MTGIDMMFLLAVKRKKKKVAWNKKKYSEKKHFHIADTILSTDFVLVKFRRFCTFFLNLFFSCTGA